MSLRHIAADQRTLAANPPLVRVDHALVGALPLPDVCAGDEAGEDVFSRRRPGFFAGVGAAVVGGGGGRGGTRR